MDLEKLVDGLTKGAVKAADTIAKDMKEKLHLIHKKMGHFIERLEKGKGQTEPDKAPQQPPAPTETESKP